MTTLTSFFKGSDTEFGIFYPKDYLIAIFADMTEAEHAVQLLRDHGFMEEDVIAVPGAEVVQSAEEIRKKDGLWGTLMQQLSRFIGTEERYTDHDLKLAARGAAFVAVYCPSEKSKNLAWEDLKPAEPLIARHYTTLGIEHLRGEV
jgi:hypothetical protein